MIKLFKLFFEFIGIQTMKATEAAEDAIDKIDRLKLQLQKEEAGLVETEKNLTTAQNDYNFQVAKREELEKSVIEKKETLLVLS